MNSKGYLNNVLGKGLTMETNDSFNNNNNNAHDNQFVISYELICLLQWILEHESELFKQLIHRAMESGIKEEALSLDHESDDNGMPTIDDIQEIIIDFFELCDTLMAEVQHEQSVKKAIEKNLMPAIDQIDSRLCDYATVRSSIDNTAAQLDHSPNASAKETLFREILKQWKPNKKHTVN